MTAVFETTDVNSAQDYLAGLYGRLRIMAGSGPQHLRVAQHDLGPVQLHHTTFTMRFEVDGEAIGRLAFGRVVSGVITYQRTRTYGTVRQVFMAVQPDEPYGATVNGADMEFAFLDPDMMAQVADLSPGRAARPVRFTGYDPVSPEAATWWNNTYDYVRDNLTTGPPARRPLVVASAARLLAVTALSVFPNDGLHDPTIEDRRDAHPVSMRRAVAFIEDNAGRDMSAAEIAAAAHVSIRSLQLAFRRHLGTTPTAYLRRVRLEQAHRDLRAADPTTATVGSVADRWGFPSHSRFTAHYHATYGVTPSRTLRSD